MYNQRQVPSDVNVFSHARSSAHVSKKPRCSRPAYKFKTSFPSSSSPGMQHCSRKLKHSSEPVFVVSYTHRSRWQSSDAPPVSFSASGFKNSNSVIRSRGAATRAPTSSVTARGVEGGNQFIACTFSPHLLASQRQRDTSQPLCTDTTPPRYPCASICQRFFGARSY